MAKYGKSMNSGNGGLPTGKGQSGTGKGPKFDYGSNANVKTSPAKKFC